MRLSTTAGRSRTLRALCATAVALTLMVAGTSTASSQPSQPPATPEAATQDLPPLPPYEPQSGPLPPPIGWQEGDPAPTPEGETPSDGNQRKIPGLGYIPSDPTNDKDYPSTLFPIRGEANGPDSALWKNMTTKISSYLGNTLGTRFWLEDQLNFRFAVTMVSQRPVVSSYCYYSPVGEGYEYLDYGTHLTIYLIVDGVQVDFMTTDDFTCDGTRSFQIDHTVNHPNQTIQVGVRAFTENANSELQTSAVKTDVFQCDPLEPGEIPPGQGTLCRPAS